MPFIDLNENRIDFASVQFDIVIVGAGAAGILLAVEMTKKKKNILLVESGHFVEDESRQALNTVSQSGKIVTNAVWGRKRAIGGTTIAWGGQSLPFGPLDFQERDWVQNSGWPLTFEELAPYYDLANRFMQIDELDYEDDIFHLLKMKRVGFNPQLIRQHFAKWAPEPNFRILYKSYLAKHVTVVYNAVVTKLNTDAGSKIENITVKNFKGQSFSIRTPQLILAAGAIETNRILLNQNEIARGSMGNQSGWLGKCFMEHPCIEVGEICGDDQWRLQSTFNTHIARKRKYSVRLSLSETSQKKMKLLNGSSGLMFHYLSNDSDPYSEIRKFLRTRKFPSIKTLKASAISSYLLSASALTLQKFVYKHKARNRIVMMLEQEPDPGSYISLSNAKDFHDMRQANIHWKITRKTWDSMLHLAKTVSTEIERLALGKVILHPHISSDIGDCEYHLADVCHHMGGTRMSATVENGVVNSNLQVWGHDNLYICSTSVFPTSSHSNPTLTLLALAQRLVEKLA